MQDTFKHGDIIDVIVPDWDSGTSTFRAMVIRETSPTHIKIKVDDGLVYAVAKDLCALVTPLPPPC